MPGAALGSALPAALPTVFAGAGVRGPAQTAVSPDALAQQIAARSAAKGSANQQTDPTTLAKRLGTQAIQSVNPVSALDVVA